MKKITFATILFLTAAGGVVPCYPSEVIQKNQSTVIENHAFGVVKDASTQVFVFIQNNDCVGTYKVVTGETVLGEGKVDFNNNPQNIPLGLTKVHIRCGGGNKLLVTAQ